MRGLICAGCISSVLWLASAAHADVRLDPGFGDQGRVMTRAQVSTPTLTDPAPVGLARAPLGRLVAAAGSTVVRYLPNGKLDKSFSDDGRLVIAPAPGTTFELSNVAVDAQGRIVVGGSSAQPLARPGESFQPPAGRLSRILRFLPSGRLDARFGGDGVIETDFGLPRPIPEPGTATPDTPQQEQTEEEVPQRPVVGSTGLALDRRGRIVVTGFALSRVLFRGGPCYQCAESFPTYSSLVARLTAAGNLDTSFGEGGVILQDTTSSPRPLPTLGAFDPMVDRFGKVRFIAGPRECPICTGDEPSGLIALTRTGIPSPRFGSAGFSPIPDITAYAITSPGGTLALAENASLRLKPDGSVDRRYGKVLLPHPSGRSSFDDLAAGPGGEAILVGTRWARARVAGKPRRRPVQKAFALSRVTEDGRLDRSVGRDGLLTTPFGDRSFAFAKRVLIDEKGRAVVAGVYRGGLALSRYLIDP
jgi:uncharacterized delta-60 repeat protein